MKTLSFRTSENMPIGSIKVDMHFTNAEIQVAGFDTLFTAMEIVQPSPFIQIGAGITNEVYSYRDVYDLADSLGLGLYLIDINESGAEVELIAPATTVAFGALTGTVSTVIGQNILYGVGTLFTSELAVGNIVEVGGEWRIVQSIVSNTKLGLGYTFKSVFSGITIQKVTL